MEHGTSTGRDGGIKRMLFTLLFASVIFSARLVSSKTSLDPVGIYGSIQQAQSCLSITWRVARQQLVGPTIANCLRFAFHDAGTYQTSTDQGGANGSIMRELDFSVFTQHNGIALCAQTMPVIIAAARTAGCPQLTAADAIQVTGAVAVAVSNGPTCNLLMGRPDKETADSLSGLPSHCADANGLVAQFNANGFRDPVTSLVVLSGAHNIGRSQVTQRGQCSKGLGPLTADERNFDGHYYNEVVNQTGRRGWFDSDLNIAKPNTPTVALMASFAQNHGAFLSSWCQHYQEASLLGVDPAIVAGLTINSGWDPNAIVPVARPPPAVQPSRPVTQNSPRPPAQNMQPRRPQANQSPLPRPRQQNGGGGGGGRGKL